MKKTKYLDPELHGTRGIKYKYPPKLTILVVSRKKYVKKAGQWLSYVRYNIKGKTDREEWGDYGI